MHGCISDHCAFCLLEYLNAIYGSYLAYDLAKKSLAGLRTDLFNLDQERVELKERRAELLDQEFKLKKRLDSLQLPPGLAENSLALIEKLKEQIEEQAKRAKPHKQKLAKLQAERVKLAEAAALFTEQAAALDKLQNYFKKPLSCRKFQT